MREAFEGTAEEQSQDGSAEASAGKRYQRDFSLKEGETMRLKLANVSLSSRCVLCSSALLLVGACSPFALGPAGAPYWKIFVCRALSEDACLCHAQ